MTQVATKEAGTSRDVYIPATVAGAIIGCDAEAVKPLALAGAIGSARSRGGRLVFSLRDVQALAETYGRQQQQLQAS